MGDKSAQIYILNGAYHPGSLTDRSRYLSVAKSATREESRIVSYFLHIFVFELTSFDTTTNRGKCQ